MEEECTVETGQKQRELSNDRSDRQCLWITEVQMGQESEKGFNLLGREK